MVIYPLCESNIYVIAPGAVISSDSSLKEKFNAKFPGYNLLEVSGFQLLSYCWQSSTI